MPGNCIRAQNGRTEPGALFKELLSCGAVDHFPSFREEVASGGQDASGADQGDPGEKQRPRHRV